MHGSNVKQVKESAPVTALDSAHSGRKSRPHKGFSDLRRCEITVPYISPWCRGTVLKGRKSGGRPRVLRCRAWRIGSDFGILRADLEFAKMLEILLDIGKQVW